MSKIRLNPSTGEFEMNENVLPDMDEVSYTELEKMRKIYLDTEIDDGVLSIQRRILRWNIEDKGMKPEDRKPIWLYIMSYGGDIDYMWSIIDTINMSVTPVYTVNMGVAGSAASLIFVSGHMRYMMPNAKVIVHEGSAQMAGDAVKVIDASNAYKEDLRSMKEYILSKTGIPKSVLYRKRNNDWTLKSDYCLENKVCDVVISNINDVL